MKTGRVIGMASALAAAALLFVAVAKVAVAAQGAADSSPARLQQLFLEASRAYDEGKPADAATLYEGLVKQGYGGPELFFNLGNAFFKCGKIGDAVLSYRRAWHFAPRDPDIQANLRFALQSSGAINPDYPSWTKALLRYSRTEWTIAATVGYWGCAATLALLLVVPSWRPVLSRVLAAGAVLLLTAVIGVNSWYALSRNTEMVVVKTGQQALFAPIEKSTAFFAVPVGSIVRAGERSGPWLRVSSGKQSGWVQASACVPVWPWSGVDNAYDGK